MPRQITEADLFNQYKRIFDTQERRITRGLTKWYDNSIIDYRRQLIGILDRIQSTDYTEDNADVNEQIIIRLLDVENIQNEFEDKARPKYIEADRVAMSFNAEVFKMDDALKDNQIGKRGKPIIAAIAGTANETFKNQFKIIKLKTELALTKRTTTDVVRNKTKGMSDDEAIEATVKKLSNEKDWRLKRIVRSNLTTFIGDRTDRMILQNDLYTGKKWFDRDDKKVRNSHDLNERQGVIPKEQLFQNGQAYPGDRRVRVKEWINCRCWLKGRK